MRYKDMRLTEDERLFMELPKLDPKFKKRWVAALRSGEYVQNQGNLCTVGETHDSFCCLGVAINETEGFMEDRNDISAGGYLTHDQCTNGLGFFTLPSKRWNSCVGLNPDVNEILAGFNDDGATFQQIARWIEEHL